MGQPEQPDDFPCLVGLEQQDEGPDVDPPHPLKRGSERLVVQRLCTNLGDLPVDGSPETGVPPAQPAVVVLEFRRDLERPRQRASPRISSMERTFRNLPLRIL